MTAKRLQYTRKERFVRYLRSRDFRTKCWQTAVGILIGIVFLFRKKLEAPREDAAEAVSETP